MQHGARGTRGLARTARLGAFALIAVVGVTACSRAPESKDPHRGRTDHAVTHAVARRETRPTLDPASFTGEVATAYQVARDIPGVLDQLHCHCNCHSQYGHASLLSCYTDGHAST